MSDEERFRAALERIVEIGEDPESNENDLAQAFRIADEALNPKPETDAC